MSTEFAEYVARPGAEDTALNTEALVRQIAHELRQPLSTIESIAYYLDMILPRDDPRARKQLDRLQRLVEQSNWIMSHAVVLAQTAPAAPRLLDPAELISMSLTEGAQGAPVEIEFSPASAQIRMDPVQGDHLFRTLLVPLRLMGSEQHPVNVRVRNEYSEILIEFSTSAPGHTSQEVQTIFSGLSQASIQHVLDAHTGTMQITADPEIGVTIQVHLPA